MDSYLIRQHEWTTLTKCWAKEARHKGAYLVCINLYILQNQAKLIYGVGSQENAYSWGGGDGLGIGKGHERGSWSAAIFYFLIWVVVTEGFWGMFTLWSFGKLQTCDMFTFLRLLYRNLKKKKKIKKEFFFNWVIKSWCALRYKLHLNCPSFPKVSRKIL